MESEIKCILQEKIVAILAVFQSLLSFLIAILEL